LHKSLLLAFLVCSWPQDFRQFSHKGMIQELLVAHEVAARRPKILAHKVAGTGTVRFDDLD
jgi:hypothetical protein